MSKKTKKQKQQTEERRKMTGMKRSFVHEQMVTPQQPITQQTMSYTFSGSTQTSGRIQPVVSKDDMEFFVYIKKDILLTIGYAVLLIGSLVALSFFLR